MDELLILRLAPGRIYLEHMQHLVGAERKKNNG